MHAIDIEGLTERDTPELVAERAAAKVRAHLLALARQIGTDY